MVSIFINFCRFHAEKIHLLALSNNIHLMMKPKISILNVSSFYPQNMTLTKTIFFTEIKCKPRTIDSFLTNWNASKHIALTYNILIQKPCCFNANLPHIFRRRLQLTVSKQISIYWMNVLWTQMYHGYRIIKKNMTQNIFKRSTISSR